MRYFDTSFLVPLILPEATSEPIARFFEDQPAGELAVSHWTRVEFASLLAREVRMGELDPADAVMGRGINRHRWSLYRWRRIGVSLPLHAERVHGVLP